MDYFLHSFCAFFNKDKHELLLLLLVSLVKYVSTGMSTILLVSLLEVWCSSNLRKIKQVRVHLFITWNHSICTALLFDDALFYASFFFAFDCFDSCYLEKDDWLQLKDKKRKQVKDVAVLLTHQSTRWYQSSTATRKGKMTFLSPGSYFPIQLMILKFHLSDEIV